MRNVSFTNADGTLRSAEQMQELAAQRVAEARARAQRVGDAIAANVAEATSHNGVATVTVQGAGTMRSVRLSDRAKGMGPAMIAGSVMEAYQQAAARAAARTRQIAADELGDERVARLMDDLVPGGLPGADDDQTTMRG